MTNKRTTIRDVAKKAGVSITTVSQILNGVDEFSDSTVKRVWDTVNAMHYVPNPFARKLLKSNQQQEAREKTNLLLRVTYTPYTHSREPFDHLEERRMAVFHKAAAKKAYYAVNYTYVHEVGFHCTLLQKDLIDGAILGLPHTEIIRMLRTRIPVVLTDLNIDPAEIGVPVVNMDFTSGFQTVFRKLTDAGYPGKLAVLHGADKHLAGYYQDIHISEIVAAAANAGMELRAEHILPLDITPDTHRKVMRETAETIGKMVRNDGIRIVAMKGFSYADALAEFLKADHLRIPEDVILISDGYLAEKREDIVILHYDWENLISTAVDIVCRMVAGEECPIQKYLIPCRIRMDWLLKKITAAGNAEAGSAH